MICHLDPDFRPKDKRNKDGSLAPMCARCKGRVNPNKCRKAWVNWETWEASLERAEIVKGHQDTEFNSVIEEVFIGPDCWKTIGLPSP